MNGISHQIKQDAEKQLREKKRAEKTIKQRQKQKQKQRKISGQERYFKNLSLSYKVTAIKSSAAETILPSSKYKNTVQG